jgi:hypothetical protein
LYINNPQFSSSDQRAKEPCGEKLAQHFLSNSAKQVRLPPSLGFELSSQKPSICCSPIDLQSTPSFVPPQASLSIAHWQQEMKLLRRELELIVGTAFEAGYT